MNAGSPVGGGGNPNNCALPCSTKSRATTIRTTLSISGVYFSTRSKFIGDSHDGQVDGKLVKGCVVAYTDERSRWFESMGTWRDVGSSSTRFRPDHHAGPTLRHFRPRCHFRTRGPVAKW